MSKAARSDWKEVIAPDEVQRFETYALMMQAIQARRDTAGGVHRALHPKGVSGLEASFKVRDDVPDHARIGIFASPKTYRAYVRFSNGSVKMQADNKPDIRGMAVKLVGVPGKKLIQGLENAVTQDFLMIQLPAISFRTADEFMFFVGAAAKPATLLPRMIGRFGLVRTVSILRGIVRDLGKVTSMAALRFYTPVPIQFGSYAVKYSVRPIATAVAPVKSDSSADSLRDELADRLKTEPIAFDFGVQFYVDPQTTPIEDASVKWLESESAFVPLATLTLEQQDTRSERGQKVAAYIEKLSFDPWHAPEEFRPVGDVMRARKVAYFASVQKRETVAEPDGGEQF